MNQENNKKIIINSSRKIKEYLNQSIDSKKTMKKKQTKKSEIYLIKKEEINYQDLDILSRNDNNIETYKNKIKFKENNFSNKKILIGLGLTLASCSTLIIKGFNKIIKNVY